MKEDQHSRGGRSFPIQEFRSWLPICASEWEWFMRLLEKVTEILLDFQVDRSHRVREEGKFRRLFRMGTISWHMGNSSPADKDVQLLDKVAQKTAR